LTPFGRFQLIKKLATGGMAEVFLARQPMGGGTDGRHVVIKRILPHLSGDPAYVKMFQNEARLAAQFSHPNIAHIFEYGEEAGTWFIAMEFIHGEDLGRLMRQAWATQQWVATPLSLRIVASACEGLHYAHQRSVVHRDISPQNILISFDGSVKVVDFGIARVGTDASSASTSGGIKGKFAYLAPEQAASGPLDARTDVFALGLVLYELLTGVRPLKRDSDMATLMAAAECVIEPPSVAVEMSGELDEIVMRALAKSPADRYPDARAFHAAIEGYLTQKQLVASSVQLSELMHTLFAARLAEESVAGAPLPVEVEVDAPTPTQRERPATSTAPRTPKRRPARASRTTTGGMPEAPPRSAVPLKSKDRSWAAPAPPSPSHLPEKKAAGSGLLFAFIVIAAIGGTGWWFWTQERFTGHPIRVSIDTTPPTQVRVVPADPGQQERSLGRTPVTNVNAMREDLIVLVNEDQCIRFEVRFPLEDPTTYKRIDKAFEKGKVKLAVTGGGKGLSATCHGRSLGAVPGTLTLYEGTPPILVSGEGLAAPVPVSVTVVPKTTQNATVEIP